ncbi:MAG: hypothetical protein OEW11_00015 [Nitrospirota bacterium]|nr:hypothetical protein [Nitrospirota bacterium]
MNDKPPTFGDWLMALPWWAKLLITMGTALGVYVSFAPLFRG